MRTCDCYLFHKRFIAWDHLILLAGLICVWDPTVQASFIVQTKALQAQTKPGTVLHGQIRLLNSYFDEPLEVSLKIVELIPTADRHWRAVDPDRPADPNHLQNSFKTQSCRKWIRLPRTEMTVGPVDVVVVSVDIRVPKDRIGLYRAAILVNVPTPYRYGGVTTGYDLVVPVLLEVKEPPKDRPFEFESEDNALEIHPEPIKVEPDWKAHDPYRMFTGAKRTTLGTTFPVRLMVTAAGISPAGGIWRASIDPNETYGTGGEIKVSITGENVRIERLTGGPKDVKVALVTVQVIPDLSDWPYFWHHSE